MISISVMVAIIGIFNIVTYFQYNKRLKKFDKDFKDLDDKKSELQIKIDAFQAVTDKSDEQCKKFAGLEQRVESIIEYLNERASDIRKKLGVIGDIIKEDRCMPFDKEPLLDEYFKLSSFLLSIGETFIPSDYLIRALYYIAKKQLDNAKTEIDELRKIKPEITSQEILTFAYIWNHQYQEALKFFDEVLQVDPNNQGICKLKEKVLNAHNLEQELLPLVKEALKLKPVSFKSSKSKKNASKLEQYKETIQSNDTTLKINPDRETIWYNKACNFSLMHDISNMLSTLQQAISINSDNKEKARQDEDFKEYWDDPDFIELTKDTDAV